MHLMDVASATLSGGVAVGAVADMMIGNVGNSLVIGVILHFLMADLVLVCQQYASIDISVKYQSNLLQYKSF